MTRSKGHACRRAAMPAMIVADPPFETGPGSIGEGVVGGDGAEKPLGVDATAPPSGWVAPGGRGAVLLLDDVSDHEGVDERTVVRSDCDVENSRAAPSQG
ncbi:hypothetical protein ABH922_002124 [Rhodococcus sp. 27YEA15]|uniref:hypothetical protein n=1 Tax=Rhodococcus sp. 27YEA15 TaxID=3156259 RepID=UPI003C7BAAB0